MLNEIKFACPYCSQHIACDPDYRDFVMDCPRCGNGIIVPHLTPSESAHPAMLVVASKAGPARPEPPPVLLPDLRAAEQWTRQRRDTRAADEITAPHWILSFIGMLIALFILRIHRSPAWLLLICLFAGTVLSVWLMAKDRKSKEAYSLLRGLGIAAALCLLLPIVALGILFIGCLAVMR